MIPSILDRYLLREWFKIFTVTTVGFPLVVMLFELTDNLGLYLSRGLEPSTIAIAYVYSLPDKVFMVLPAAVLFATVFSVSAMSRHSELSAAKASGLSFRRIVSPVFVVAALAAILCGTVGELAPTATRRQLELLGEQEIRNQTSRQNFVYRAELGWVYFIRSLNLGQRQMYDVVLEREGTGEDYPTLVMQAKVGLYNDSTAAWMLRRGRFRVLAEPEYQMTVKFDSLRSSHLTETPSDLLAEPKKPQEMSYGELGLYIDALERSGGDGRQLTVERALKIAVPVTCLIIALFGAPLVATAPRASGAFGVAVSLGTTLIFLVMVQLSRAVGAGGLLPPTLAAWTPNMLFGAAALTLLKRAPT
jgi:lipopolysaccharide export system permease protein